MLPGTNDVLIKGGGPVGLTFGSLAAQRARLANVAALRRRRVAVGQSIQGTE